MATNEVFRNAEHLTLPVPTGTLSGDPVIVGSMPGVAITDRDTDGTATVWMKGAFDLTVNGAVTAVGAPLYIDDSGTRQTQLTTTATDNALFGYALATKTAAAAVATVRIAQV